MNVVRRDSAKGEDIKTEKGKRHGQYVNRS